MKQTVRMNPVPDNSQLIARIDAYCEAKGLTRSAFGELCTGHRTLCTRLLQGRHIYAETLNKVECLLRCDDPYAAQCPVNELLE